jgi:alpha-D-ribose 1-methylphosphonate 5-triphosphate synthase subunit PhnG
MSSLGVLTKKTCTKSLSQVFCVYISYSRADPTGVEYSRSKSGGTGKEFWLFSVEISEAEVRLDVKQTLFVVKLSSKGASLNLPEFYLKDCNSARISR